ncbi:uncharacterized protein LOC116215275 isoform X2 [Punica granatum]|uniref:tRNA (guanine(46)-N(7))-methyltransferase n=1 Tax=Punica granatum TaxID=22663 RepID=A0A6P8EK86_PUNGR|nr:uncharacterized protein LOC116215275 isoform X2 [Punica granatum]
MVALRPFPTSFNCYFAASKSKHSSLLSSLKSSLFPCPRPPLPPPSLPSPATLSTACSRLRESGFALEEDEEEEGGAEQQQPRNQQLRSPDLVALEYAELNLPHRTAEMPVEAPQWESVFKDPALPLMVDIGSGSGRFLIWLAKAKCELGNYLGLEIRQKLVKRANCWVKELQLDNIHFLFANASVSFNNLISSYPGPLAMVSILCPDPHFKKRHHKRRVVQKPLVDSILCSLAPGGKVFVQSDVFEVAVDMRNQFDEKLDVLQHIDSVDPDVSIDGDGWLRKNPMGIRTEREIHAEFEGAKVYRRMYQKKLI